MKKGFVALLIVLAIVVLVSPGIVGRLAEKSMDENLDWAATESQEVIVSSQGFARGWFSSAGKHRVEVRPGRLQDLLLALTNSDDDRKLPALIIDTRLDHGLIPVASMSRDQGSLFPGLGSAISTLSVELADGEVLQVPGTIYSNVSLTGELRSKYELEAGTHDFVGANARWGDTRIEIATDPANGTVSFDGLIDSMSMIAGEDVVLIRKVEFTGKQRRSRFGFAVGDVDLALESLAVGPAGESASLGPLLIAIESELSGDRVSAHTTMTLDNTPFGELGAVDIAAEVHIIDVDGAAVGNITRALRTVSSTANPDELMLAIEGDVQRLLASGLELRFNQLDIALPQGQITSAFRIVVAENDADPFTWASVLLGLDATAAISLPAELVDIATSMNPQLHAVIGMGFLRKSGDAYEMQASFKKGLLTVNGAPMPIPILGVQ